MKYILEEIKKKKKHFLKHFFNNTGFQTIIYI